MARVLTERDEAKLFDLAVLSWRYEELCRAGYPVLVAADLAESAHVDLHQAVALLARGCSVKQAVRILL